VTFEEITSEFIKENESNLGQFMPKLHKRGSCSNQELEQRRSDVYGLHFEYGYSSRKISNILNEQSFQILGTGIAR
jgi:hypothetical protein